jgi:hypothetical protein
MFRILLLSAIIGLVTTTMTASVKVEKTEYKGWPTCYRVSNGEIDLIVTGDVGPRVIRFGFVGGQNQYMMLRQDPKNAEAQKLGLFNPETWAVYVLNNEVFVKRATADPTQTYADFGCSFETFTNNEFLEMETLGPMTKVAPGQTVEQVEHFGLYRSVTLSAWDDEELDRVLVPLIRAVESAQ